MTPPSRSLRFPLLAASLAGLSGVALGAFGAHALAAKLAERGMTHSWETAARYHVYHALAMLAVAIWIRIGAEGAVNKALWAIRCWTVGTILFSGSLYGLALGGPRWLGPVTPVGGIALMIGWACVLLAAFDAED